MRSVRRYLVAISLFLVALVIAAAALVVYEVERASRQQAEQQLLSTTRALSLVVDGELKRSEAILKLLATSPRLTEGDWRGFDRRARELVHEKDAWLVLTDRQGRQLVNTGLPPGAALPSGMMPPEVWRELARTGSRVCNLTEGYIEPVILCVDVAAPPGKDAKYVLSVVMRPAQLTSILRQQRIAQGTYATVLDRNGVVVWRNVRADRFIGKPATGDILAAMRRGDEGVRESHSLEGDPTVAAFSRSPYSGWTFIVGLPRSSLRASGNALPLAIGAAALLILIGAGVGLLAARRIARAARHLAATAEQVERGEAAAYAPTGLEEIDAAGHALKAAFERQRASESRYRLIFEQSSDLILTADLDQVITDCNPSAAVAVGVTREEAIGRNIAEFISPDDYARTTAMLRQKIGQGGTTRYDVRVRNSRGEWLDWEINSGLMYAADGAAIGLHVVGRDVTERKRGEARQQLLINELNHRVKNTLAVVQALAHQSLKGASSIAEGRAAFDARLRTLAAAHDLLTKQSWEPVTLQEVVDAAAGAACGAGVGRHSAQGPQVTLAPQTAVSVAMMFHELCTNATKYGALSNDTGTVTTRWTVQHERGEDWLDLEWVEQGGPPVVPPERTGFGTRMIERVLSADLAGTVALDFRREGLVCRVRAPLGKAALPEG